MTSRDEELHQFKTGINLSELAAAYGFEIDRRSTSRNSVAMKHADGEKLILGMDGDTWVYFAVHGGHRGTVIDFIQARDGLNLGQVRRVLRSWLGVGDGRGSSPTALPRPAASAFVKKLDAVKVDLDAVQREYNVAEDVEGHHPYLCDQRAIPAALLASDRFAGRVRIDRRGNALFPHWNADKRLCGFEIKNDGFTGYAKHGTKGLWCSHGHDGDRRLIAAETAIDALSHAAIKGYADGRFFSIAGQMNPQQPGLLHRAIRQLPTESQVVLAVDHDDGGDQLIEHLRPIFDHVVTVFERGDLTLVVDRPEVVGADWNDVLRQAGNAGSRPDAAPTPRADA